MYLEVTLTNGQNFSIPIEAGHTTEQELELFLKREGRFAGEWEQVVLVSPKSDRSA